MKNRKIELLSPNDQLRGPEYENYKYQLDSALSNGQAKNIAISGKYGSGKSSVIDTYFRDRDKDDFLKVSFADFNGGNRDAILKEEGTNKSENEQYLKNYILSNIINQIIYQIPSRRIPITRFKSKRGISNFTILTIIGTFVLTLIALNMQPLLLKEKVETFALGGMALLLLIFLRNFEFKQLRFSFKNINAEIDMRKDDLFEKYTDEIIYLFRHSKKKILIIEDIDRFEEPYIFIQLREINTKLNLHSQSKRGKRNWTFLYLMKDDMFLDNLERVKFFDLIIPIIPFITTTNSSDILRSKLPEFNNSNLIGILGVYIDDYRLLQNIYNEYLIYSEQLNLDASEELLSLIAYKNLQPNKFDELQNGKGLLFEIVNSFENKITGRLHDKKKTLDEIDRKNKDDSLSLEMKRLLYWTEERVINFSENGQSWMRLYSGRGEDAKKIIVENLKIQVSEPFSSKIVEREYDSYETFKEDNYEYRVKIPQSNVGMKEMVRLKREINELENYQLSSIEKEDYPFENDDLLFVLLKNGFITKNYMNVINRSHGHVIDSRFIKNVHSRNDDDLANVVLFDPQKVFDNLSLFEYGYRQILNYSYFVWLGENGKINHLAAAIETAQREGDVFLEDLIRMYPKVYKWLIEASPDVTFSLDEIDDNQLISYQVPDSDEETSNLSGKKIVKDIIENERFIFDEFEYSALVSLLFTNYTQDEILTDVISNDKVSDEVKSSLVAGELDIFPKAIENIFDTDRIFWDSLMKKGLIEPNFDNVKEYYYEFGFDDYLVEAINLSEFEYQEFDEDFYKDTMSSEKLTSARFKDIWIKKQGLISFDFLNNIENVDPNKMQILFNMERVSVDLNVLTMPVMEEIEIPNNLITDELKQKVLEVNNFILPRSIVIDFLRVPGRMNHEIFKRFINVVLDSDIKNYLLKNDFVDAEKIIKIIEKGKNYQNIRKIRKDPYGINELILARLSNTNKIDSVFTRNDGLLGIRFAA